MQSDIIDIGIAHFKIMPKEERKIVLIGKCPFCEKTVRGTTHDQLEWNLTLHARQKHQDDEEAQILINQLEEQRKARSK